MSFTKKKINVQFTLANGSFGSGKNNTATITGLRVLANIVVTGGETQATAELAIYGLPLDMMNQLSVVGTQINAIAKNSITVEAGDDESGMHLVFAGNIINAFVDANNMPNVCLRVSASPGAYYAMKPTQPLSIKGSADAAGMMQKIASQMGLGFENNGVTAKLANPYFGGTLLTQAKAIARHAGFDMFIDKKHYGNRSAQKVQKRRRYSGFSRNRNGWLSAVQSGSGYRNRTLQTRIQNWWGYQSRKRINRSKCNMESFLHGAPFGKRSSKRPMVYGHEGNKSKWRYSGGLTWQKHISAKPV